MYKITVIVPVYNAENHLRRCVDSILHQTFYDFELLLINDGSIDKSASICDSYKNDVRIRVIHQANQGVSIARNIGLNNARGEYIAFVDADDYLESNALEILYANICQGYDLVCGAFRRVTSSDFSYECRLKPQSLTVFQLAQLCWNMNFHIILGSVWGKLYRRQIIEDNDIQFPTAISYAEDNIFNIRYYRQIKTALMLDSVIYNYFCNSNSLATKFSYSMIYDSLCVCEIRKKYFKKLLRNNFDLGYFSNQYIATLVPILRILVKEYNKMKAYKLLRCILANNEVKQYIYHCKLSYNMNIPTKLVMSTIKLRCCALVLLSLMFVNFIASNRFVRVIYKRKI